MGETDAQEKKPKISKLAIASVSLGIVGLLARGIKVGMVLHPYWLKILLRNIMGVLGILGVILGVVALVWIQISRGMLKSRAFAIFGMVLAALLSGIWWWEIYGHRSTTYRMVCASNLSLLGNTILIYANDNGQYPDPNQWCDLLLQHGRVVPKHFICHFGTSAVVLQWPPNSGRICMWPELISNYAMNPNCRPNSPPETVLLFEAEEGWNQFGGPEILSLENHEGQGCNILFNDGTMRFVKPKETSRFVKPVELGALKWKDEQKQ